MGDISKATDFSEIGRVGFKFALNIILYFCIIFIILNVYMQMYNDEVLNWQTTVSICKEKIMQKTKRKEN